MGALESIQPTPIVDIDGVPMLPTFRLYPMIDQIVDKVAAMYETHGEAPSNRYRDLVDLALLVGSQEFDAGPLLTALQSRVRNARNPVVLPTAVESPGEGWATGYPTVARGSSLPVDLHRLDSALVLVGRCLNPILNGTVKTGRWSSEALAWA